MTIRARKLSENCREGHAASVRYPSEAREMTREDDNPIIFKHRIVISASQGCGRLAYRGARVRVKLQDSAFYSISD